MHIYCVKNPPDFFLFIISYVPVMQRLFYKSLSLLTYLAFGEKCKSISSRRHIELRWQHIENPVRDLSRCVFSVKDNTLMSRAAFCIA